MKELALPRLPLRLMPDQSADRLRRGDHLAGMDFEIRLRLSAHMLIAIDDGLLSRDAVAEAKATSFTGKSAEDRRR